jgi:hypothetical protein
MSTGKVVGDLVEKYTVEGIVDLDAVVLKFGATIKSEIIENTWRGKLTYDENDGVSPVFTLNESNTPPENKCTLALLFAKYLIQLGIGSFREHTVDAFFLQDIRQYRESPQIMLATHLAIPPEVLAQVNEITFNSSEYARSADLTTNFINSAFNVSRVAGLLSLFTHLNITSDGRQGRIRTRRKR